MNEFYTAQEAYKHLNISQHFFNIYTKKLKLEDPANDLLAFKKPSGNREFYKIKRQYLEKKAVKESKNNLIENQILEIKSETKLMYEELIKAKDKQIEFLQSQIVEKDQQFKLFASITTNQQSIAMKKEIIEEQENNNEIIYNNPIFFSCNKQFCTR